MILKLLNVHRNYSQLRPLKSVLECCPSYMELSATFGGANEQLGVDLLRAMSVHENFITEPEERSILSELEPYLKRMRYEFSHWDDAIHGYRETERTKWTDENERIVRRVRKFAFPPGVAPLEHVHVLDLAKEGHIKPHIDAVRFCGDTIAGLSLLTDSVMRLVHDGDNALVANVLLRRRSLYVMKGTARYDYKHEILKTNESEFGGKKVDKDRRISVICRCQPNPNKEE